MKPVKWTKEFRAHNYGRHLGERHHDEGARTDHSRRDRARPARHHHRDGPAAVEGPRRAGPLASIEPKGACAVTTKAIASAMKVVDREDDSSGMPSGPTAAFGSRA